MEGGLVLALLELAVDDCIAPDMPTLEGGEGEEGGEFVLLALAVRNCVAASTIPSVCGEPGVRAVLGIAPLATSPSLVGMRSKPDGRTTLPSSIRSCVWDTPMIACGRKGEWEDFWSARRRFSFLKNSMSLSGKGVMVMGCFMMWGRRRKEAWIVPSFVCSRALLNLRFLGASVALTALIANSRVWEAGSLRRLATDSSRRLSVEPVSMSASTTTLCPVSGLLMRTCAVMSLAVRSASETAPTNCVGAPLPGCESLEDMICWKQSALWWLCPHWQLGAEHWWVGWPGWRHL